jgi:hypothetical protein
MLTGTDLLVEPSEDAVVLEQVRHRRDVAEVVEGDHLQVVAPGQHGAEEVTADAAEAVDAYANRHCSALLKSRPGPCRAGASSSVHPPP